jgi:predicted secreted protein
MGQETMKRTGLILALSLIVACSPQTTEPTSTPQTASTPDPVVQFDPDRLRAIADVFATEHGMMNLCSDDVPVRLTLFMAELGASTTPPELVSSLMAANDAKIEELRIAEKEYICTPEMFESREANSAAAQKEWNVMRGAE